MVYVWPIVATVIFGLVSILGTTAIIYKRAHPFIKCRNPFFLVLQNMGTLLAATLTTLYLALRPHFSCYLYYFTSLLAFSQFAFPLGLRIWEYSMNFHLAQVRAKYRDNIMTNWAQTSWFFRNRWASSLGFLRKVYFLGFWFWLLPLIPYIVTTDQYDYNEAKNGCKTYPPGIYVSIVFVLIYLAAAIFITVLIWGSRDAYKIKKELTILSVTWIIVIVIWTPYASLSFHAQKDLPSTFWILIGYYITFIVSNLWPLYMVYQDTKNFDAGLLASGYKEFIDQLEFLPFRNAFNDFLALQFCQENILFYEAVMEWRRLPTSNEKRTALAISIKDNYILEEGACQVNISGPTRDKVVAALKKEEVPGDVFDEALTSVLANMHTNSYYQFKSHALYANAKA